MPEYEVDLPEIFPLKDVRVENEQHFYQVLPGGSKDEYTLDKAPIEQLQSVVGTVNESSGFEFTKGVDYELSADAERLVWLSGERPDAGSYFAVTYRAESVIGRYAESSDEQFANIEDELISITQEKFLGTLESGQSEEDFENAQGQKLDEIGKLFGPIIGDRRERSDTQYRIYLKSVVQSFISRGTKQGIKLAVSAATDVPIEDITINENFQNSEYGVVVQPNTPVRGSVIEEIAEIADPSGVDQVRTRFTIDIDVVGVSDQILPVGQTIDVSADTVTSDDAFVDDARFIDRNKETSADAAASDDTFVGTTETFVHWDSNDWNDLEWAIEHN